VEEQRQIYMSTLSQEEAAYVLKLDALAEGTDGQATAAAEAALHPQKTSFRSFLSFWGGELRMLLRIPVTAWLLFLICGIFYVAILNFYQVASDILQKTGNHISQDTAGLYLAIPNIFAIIGAPIGGYMVDKFGRALIFIATACVMLIAAHVFFLALAYGWVVTSPIPAMLWLGATYSLGASCIWPILSFVVEKEALGSAYGMMTALQNLIGACFSLAIGKLQGQWHTLAWR